MEIAKRDTVVTKLETEKKEIQDKLDKMKLQFEKAAIESKRQMAKLEDDCNSSGQVWPLIHFFLFLFNSK